MYICVGFYQKDVHVFGKVVLCVLAYPSQSCVYMYIDFLKVDQRYTFVFSCTKGIETQIHKSIKKKERENYYQNQAIKSKETTEV